MKIILLGKQGSGKGTLGKIIAEKYKVPHIVTGDLLRDVAKEKTELGRKVKVLLDAGKFAPNELTIKIILEKIKGKDFVLDGYPRNLEQAKAFENVKVDLALVIEISDKTAIRRLSARRQCNKCGAIYNLLTVRPKKPGVCDKCGSKLTQREDDKEEAIKKRLELYKKETIPIINLYKRKGLLKVVKGEDSPEKVFKDVCEILDKIKTKK